MLHEKIIKIERNFRLGGILIEIKKRARHFEDEKFSHLVDNVDEKGAAWNVNEFNGQNSH